MKKWIALLCLVPLLVFAAENFSKVIQLQYVNADKMVSLLQPLLQQGDKISGSGQTLVVNVSPDTLTKIREIVHQLDKPPVTFKVSIYQGDPNWLDSQNGNTISISTGPKNNQPTFQSVNVMNGESAFISTAQNQPEVSAVGIGWWTGVSYERRVLKNGFLIRPVMQGNSVKLSIKRVRDQNSSLYGQVYDQQQVDTTITVPLDKWSSLSSAENDSPQGVSSQTITAGNTYKATSSLYVKVNRVGN